MASAWIVKRAPNGRAPRYEVRFRLGGRESRQRYGGSFRTKAAALTRLRWIENELAAFRVPDLHFQERAVQPSLAAVAEKWRASRIDVQETTGRTHQTHIDRILPVLGDRPIDAITVQETAEFIGNLGLKRETIRKTRSALAMIFDFGGIVPNPARDKRVKLPAEDRPEVNPPTADHVLAVYGAIPTSYKLPLLMLDATGMRVNELGSLTWGDVDQHEQRWRVSKAAAKTRRARWVPVPTALFEAMNNLCPPEDRELGARVFSEFGDDKFRTAITRACRATGVPHFSPHDLRHRRASLWHLGGMPVAEACAKLGHSAQVHLGLYAHVLLDRTEIEYANLLGSTRSVRAPVRGHTLETVN